MLAKHYHKLIEKIWINGEKVINPLSIKQLVSRKNQAFSGYGQQDAHEFMSYLLDGLHEVDILCSDIIPLIVNAENRVDILTNHNCCLFVVRCKGMLNPKFSSFIQFWIVAGVTRSSRCTIRIGLSHFATPTPLEALRNV